MSNILYFVGAGLTKSLEHPSKRIPLMADFVSVMTDYFPDPVVLTSLSTWVQAGLFEWPFDPEDIKLAKELGEGDGERTPERIEQFKALLRRRPAENIEDLLKRTYNRSGLNACQGILAESSPIRFNFAINRIFAKISWDIVWDPLEEFLRKRLCKPGTVHTFVSFNYDLILDRCIKSVIPTKWFIASGYGFEIPCFDENSEWARSHIDYRAAKTLNTQKSNILILKPHGSLNWMVRFENNFNFENTVAVFSSDGNAVDYLPPSENYEFFELANHGGQYAPFLIPPGRSKHRPLFFIQETIKREKKAIKEADDIFLLGWSMPDTDKDQQCLIRSCVRERPNPIKCMTVVSLNAEPEYFQRVADVFGVEFSTLKIYNNGFRDFAASS